MAKYKVISKFDEVQRGTVKFVWKNADQARLADAYNMGLTDHVEKIEDKPKVEVKKSKKIKKDEK
jgi:hypothetical protein